MLQTMKKHRFLLEELAKRNFDRKYKGALLGAAWSVMNPLLTLLIMRVVFGHFFGSAIPHYTTYLFCGVVVFNFFPNRLQRGCRLWWAMRISLQRSMFRSICFCYQAFLHGEIEL